MQPFKKSQLGVVRFEANRIVNYLLHHGGIDMNQLIAAGLEPRNNFTQKDWEQFYQLIGYSLCGYHELNQVSDEAALAASQAARAQGFDDAGGCRDDGCEIHCGVPVEP